LTVTLSPAQVCAAGSMVALRVNGADLSLDHGFPARVMVPAAPGTHNVKWIAQIEFSEAS
jgi:DMSO/TMAO reductase YedYZ molybdopterin-dependent catalytic subunit